MQMLMALWRMMENGTLFAMQGSVGGQVSLLKFYKTLENTLTKKEPSLNPGDVIIFDRCTVHSGSGVNTRKVGRNAWQIRVFAEPQEVVKELIEHYPSTGIMDKKNANNFQISTIEILLLVNWDI